LGFVWNTKVEGLNEIFKTPAPGYNRRASNLYGCEDAQKITPVYKETGVGSRLL